MFDAPPEWPIPRPSPSADDHPELTEEQRMLLDLRDVLYEGNWDDFRNDLTARQESRPHVFDTIPPSPGLRDTIARHLRVIDELEHWERTHRRRLHGSA